VNSVVGRDRLSKLDIIIAGDDVTEKKPRKQNQSCFRIYNLFLLIIFISMYSCKFTDPMIYDRASERLGVHPSDCIVIEGNI
jgi:FMN phosphatase YigB (HAD superfamily)